MSIAILNQNTGITSWMPNSIAKSLFERFCSALTYGSLIIHDHNQKSVFGEEISNTHKNPGSLTAEIHILDQSFYSYVINGGANGAADAYIRGYWTSPDLVALIRIMAVNKEILDQIQSPISGFIRIASKLRHYLNKNTLSGSKRNISAHYDLSNDFFSLFLDSRLMYSSAIYPTGNETLEQASTIKLDRICQKLNLTPNDHLLEIGTGWGGMAIFAAEKYGCKVTTTTISDEQYNEAEIRIKKAGLNKKITLLKEDYRNLSGQYDKVVSIEMIEAVGHHYLDNYFEKVSSLLKDNGTALIQAITIDDQRYNKALHEVDFIKRYIFPGSFIPCNRVMIESAARQNLRLFNLEDIGQSYAQTIAHWRESFLEHLDEVKQQGFDEYFIRMWDFYLCYCEGGFRERAISDVQLLFTKPGYRGVEWFGVNQ